MHLLPRTPVEWDATESVGVVAIAAKHKQQQQQPPYLIKRAACQRLFKGSLASWTSLKMIGFGWPKANDDEDDQNHYYGDGLERKAVTQDRTLCVTIGAGSASKAVRLLSTVLSLMVAPSTGLAGTLLWTIRSLERKKNEGESWPMMNPTNED